MASPARNAASTGEYEFPDFTPHPLLRSGHAPLQLPGLAMQVVDTIGAGDTFTGALAAHLAQGATLETSMRRANAAAALSVTGTGAIGGMPTQAQVRALLATI